MNERLTTRDLAELLANQTGLDKKRAEEFIDTLSSHIAQGIERNKLVKILGLGTFKIVLVRERESVHIQTGERFVIPAHHKLSFVPDKDFKEQINRPFAFFEPVEAMDNEALVAKPKKVTFKKENENRVDDEVVSQQDEIVDSTVHIIDEDDQDMAEEFDETQVVSDVEDQLEDEDLPEITESNSVVPEINDETISEKEYDFSDIEEPSEVVEYPEPVSFVDHTEYEESEPELENLVYTDAENKEEHIDAEQNKTSEKKSKSVPVWLWFLLLPLLFVVGVGSGTYAFLQYNSDKTSETEQQAMVVSEISGTAAHSPLPIGAIPISDSENPDVANEDEPELVDDQLPDDKADESLAMKEDNKNEVNNPPVPDTTEKKEEKKVIDWLAPSSDSPKTGTKRADKPNKEIEEKNKALANSAKAKQTSSANTAKGTAEKDKSTKTLPARVRMSAGSSLTQIAMEYYGDKIFWVYIYEHNKSRIKNFDNIPVGTELQLPLPKTYGIDAKSSTSVQKARQKQSQLMKWDNWDDYK